MSRIEDQELTGLDHALGGQVPGPVPATADESSLHAPRSDVRHRHRLAPQSERSYARSDMPEALPNLWPPAAMGVISADHKPPSRAVPAPLDPDRGVSYCDARRVGTFGSRAGPGNAPALVVHERPPRASWLCHRRAESDGELRRVSEGRQVVDANFLGKLERCSILLSDDAKTTRRSCPEPQCESHDNEVLQRVLSQCSTRVRTVAPPVWTDPTAQASVGVRAATPAKIVSIRPRPRCWLAVAWRSGTPRATPSREVARSPRSSCCRRSTRR
jgi:hypothetical protein